MKCEGGTTSKVDRCFEPCGDGMNAGFYKCDDGNMFDGDGCSSICDVEPGF
jgi:cysteine-rich repeat protein